MKKSLFLCFYFLIVSSLNAKYEFDSISDYATKINEHWKGKIVKISSEFYEDSCSYIEKKDFKVRLWIFPQETVDYKPSTLNKFIIDHIQQYFLADSENWTDILVDISFDNFKDKFENPHDKQKKQRLEIFQMFEFLGFKKIHINPIVMEQYGWSFQESNNIKNAKLV